MRRRLPVSFGDLNYVGQGVACAVRHREWGCLRKCFWVIRENHRRGTWQPFTFRRYLAMRRKLRALDNATKEGGDTNGTA